MQTRIALIGGQGWPLTETEAGLPTLGQRYQQEGIEVQTFAPEDRQGVYNWLHGFVGWRGLNGDSLGAARSGVYAGDLEGEVDFAGGFQPSDWDPVAQTDKDGRRIIVIAKNIRVAHCIYDPNFVDTGGLGNARYVITPGAKTKLTVTEHPGAHPDDWGYSQDLMFAHVMLCIKQAAS